jgi:hypothetical protein
MVKKFSYRVETLPGNRSEEFLKRLHNGKEDRGSIQAYFHRTSPVFSTAANKLQHSKGKTKNPSGVDRKDFI